MGAPHRYGSASVAAPSPFSVSGRVRAMRAVGATDRAIAAAFGVSVQALYSRRVSSRLKRGKPVSDECHGDCDRWVDRYHVGEQIVKPPDHCGGCARAISDEAKEEEAQRVRMFLQGVSRAVEPLLVR